MKPPFFAGDTMNPSSSRTKNILNLATLKFKEAEDSFDADDIVLKTIEISNEENVSHDNLPLAVLIKSK